MADTVTTNYEFVLPEPNGSDDAWGVKLNDNWAALDTLINAQSNTLTSHTNSLSSLDGRITLNEGKLAYWNNSSITQTNLSDGWYQMPNGIVHQWGRVAITATTMTVTFPKQFLKVFNLQLTNETGATDTSGIDFPSAAQTGTVSVSGFVASTGSNYPAFHWFAIGYGYVP